MTQQRRGSRHVRAYGYGPESELIIGQQISRERKQQRKHQEQHADVPVKLSRLLIRTGQEDTEHVEPDADHHEVGGPTVHVTQNLSERNIVLEIEYVAEGLHLARVVIEHQQHAGIGEDDEQVERDPAHAPRVAVAHGITIDLCWMQVQEDVREYAESAIARRVVVLVAKDRRVDLSFRGIFQALDLLFRLGGDVGLESLNVVFDSRGDL